MYPEDRGRCCSNIFGELREGGYEQVTGLVLAKSLDRSGKVNWSTSLKGMCCRHSILGMGLGSWGLILPVIYIAKLIPNM